MKAVVLHGKQDLRWEEVEEPRPGPAEVVVAVDYGGICGSDLHYWRDGSAGTSILRAPLVLGHEVAGTVVEHGSEAIDVAIGTPVTIHPAATCQGCAECAAGQPNLCSDATYFGSAARLPHTAGAFARYRAVPRDQLRLLPPGLPMRHGAVAEPLGVAVHALHRAGSIRGRSVLVNGAGPIGCLLVAAARAAGAEQVHAADLAAESLAIARAMGADRTVHIGADELPREVDVVFEASGAPAALGGCFDAVRRGGTVVQVGNLPPGVISAELASLVTKEVTYAGSYRFVDEITDAVALLAGTIDVEPLLTHTFTPDRLSEAFHTALDRRTSSKVLLDFTDRAE
ncbi:L-idonate 5-dehydrogenase [Saccharopolyspora hattusasensis]|uniref:L-idonate 5-dehydrogenase n=1 Tax=Saccharopolyspora hattusasensis TaxID=1128679 RepID=UPI003D97CFFD